jgi:hypothetical protein
MNILHAHTDPTLLKRLKQMLDSSPGEEAVGSARVDVAQTVCSEGLIR